MFALVNFDMGEPNATRHNHPTTYLHHRRRLRSALHESANALQPDQRRPAAVLQRGQAALRFPAGHRRLHRRPGTPRGGRMTAAPCTLPRPGLCFPLAPEKRQLERSTVPESGGFLCPDSARNSLSVSIRNVGTGGMRVPQGRAPLSSVVSQTRQFPAPRRFNPADWRLKS